MKAHARAGVSGIAWAIVPAALLFVLFFALPFGVMAALSLLSGNPVSNPNGAFTYTDRPIRNRRDALRGDQGLAARVAFSLMSQGFFMLVGRTNLSTAITHADIDDFVEALAVAFQEAGACA